MITVVTDKKKISECQMLLHKSLSGELNEKKTVMIGCPSGSWEADINYNSDIWYHHYKRIGKGKSPRYDNRFGLSADISTKNTVSIVVEINVPLEGVDRRVAGFFAEDSKGYLYLMHRGKIGGGRTGIGKNAFIGHMRVKNKGIVIGSSKPNLVKVPYPGKQKDLAIMVTTLGKWKKGKGGVKKIQSPKIAKEITTFVQEVSDFKKNV